MLGCKPLNVKDSHSNKRNQKSPRRKIKEAVIACIPLVLGITGIYKKLGNVITGGDVIRRFARESKTMVIIISTQTLMRLFGFRSKFSQTTAFKNHVIYMEEKKKLSRQVYFRTPTTCRPLMRGIKAIKENNASLKL
jgi:hypothetical protein